MGTREVYEEKLKRGNLHHDPTIKPGLGTARCPRCLSLLNSNSKSGEWAITPVLHDFTAVAGSGIGGLLSAIHGFNTGIPFVQRRVKGPKWLPFVIGLPPLLMFSAASATFGAQCHKGSSPQILCLRQFRICTSKVYSTYDNFILHCFKCLTLRNIIVYQTY